MKVAVIQGGPSAEAEVSRASAKGVAAALEKAGHQTHRLELEPVLAQTLLQRQFDVVFPVTHGKLGEDGGLQGLLEVLGLPYVGSPVIGCAMAADKVRAKHAFRAHDLPVAEQFVISAGDDLDKALVTVIDRLGNGVAVKPASQGSAIGVSLVKDARKPGALRAAIDNALQFDDVVLCERLIRGREATCGVLDVPSLGGLRALPVTEIFSKAADWYDFTSKYAAGGSVHECPARFPLAVVERVQALARQAHRALGCRDLSRVDFMVGDGDNEDAITLLEVNVIPGMTATSLYPEAAAAAGIAFDVLCDAFARNAAERVRDRTIAALPMP